MADKSSDSCAFLLLVGIHRPVFFVTEQLYGPGPTRLHQIKTRSTQQSPTLLLRPVPSTVQVTYVLYLIQTQPRACISSSSSSTQLSPIPCLKDRPSPNSPVEPLRLYQLQIQLCLYLLQIRRLNSPSSAPVTLTAPATTHGALSRSCISCRLVDSPVALPDLGPHRTPSDPSLI